MNRHYHHHHPIRILTIIPVLLLLFVNIVYHISAFTATTCSVLNKGKRNLYHHHHQYQQHYNLRKQSLVLEGIMSGRGLNYCYNNSNNNNSNGNSRDCKPYFSSSSNSVPDYNNSIGGYRTLSSRLWSTTEANSSNNDSNDEEQTETTTSVYASAVSLQENELLRQISDKMGRVDPERLMFDASLMLEDEGYGTVAREAAHDESASSFRLFSNIKYEPTGVVDEATGKMQLSATREIGSTFGAAALIAGTTIGAGVLALPAATAPVGFVPSTAALFLGWGYMAASALLIAELAMNRIAETGRPGVGLLDMQRSYLGKFGALAGGVAFFFLHYAVMVAYMAQGGANIGFALNSLGLESINGLNQAVFAGLIGSTIYFAKPSVMEKLNNILVVGVLASFCGLVALGAGTVDVSALIAPENQNPELVLNTFPIIYLSMVYHNVVPTVVTQLEGDVKKIRTAILGGSFVPLVMYWAWNAVILGNVLGSPDAAESITSGQLDPVAFLQSGQSGGDLLGGLVGTFSQLAVITSLIGFVYGIQDGLRDIFSLPKDGPEYEKWKPALFAGTLLPPVILASDNPDIFLKALEYGGLYGVSTLFLVLPPLMVWKVRYEDENRKIATLPLLPGGKISLGSLWKASGTVIVEQGLEKLGLFTWIGERWSEINHYIAIH